MSQSDDPPAFPDRPIVNLLQQWYQIPVLLGVIAVMLWTRLQSYTNFIQDGEVYFRGNDPWYHLRETTYIIENYPNRMPFDVFTGFPTGTQAGQFGTLWDHIMAVGIWIAEPIMGGPEEVLLIMSPLAGAMVAIPTYFIAQRFVDRLAALGGAVTLALLPGTFFSYSLVGFPDHSAAEVLFQGFAILGFLTALGVAERQKPVWELVVDRDWAALREPVGYAVVAGVALGAYIWTWQPGILVVGFTGIYLAVRLTSDTYHENSPEPVAFAGAVAMAIAGLMQVIPLDTFRFAVSEYSYLQIVFPLGVAIGAVFLAWLARVWESRDLETNTYPLAVGGLITASAGIIWLAIPSLWSTLTGNLLSTVGFSATANARTIGEAQPPLQSAAFADFVIAQYGLALFLALGAILYVIARPLYDSDEFADTIYIGSALALVGSIYAVPQLYGAIGGIVGVSWQVVGLAIATALLVGATFRVEYDAEKLYLVVWAAFIVSAAFTQSRFNYYLAVVVAVGAAYFLQISMNTLDLRSVADLRDIQGWQAMVAIVIIAVLIVPLVASATPVWAAGANTGPGAVTQWDGSLQWMNDETPVPGELGSADNAMEPYDTYERPPNDNFEYPQGAYGVQSWWDYGHWITTRAERIPSANPFQQGAGAAADYLLAPTEQRGNELLETRGRTAEQTRYVMIDWQMVSPGSKLSAPTVFYDDGEVSASDLRSVVWQETQQGGVQPAYFSRNQRYHESMMMRLYHHHGSAIEPEPVVTEWRTEQLQRQDGSTFEAKILAGEDGIRTFANITAAREYVADRNQAPGVGAQIGGIGQVPSERVPALEHYRLVHSSEATALSDRRFNQQFRGQVQQAQRNNVSLAAAFPTDPDYVKTFEKVPGATVRGSGAIPGEQLRVSVRMERPGGALQQGNQTATFPYVQNVEAGENGEFELTVPYSTEGYEDYGPENGYTNVSVRATGNYTVVGSQRVSEEGDIVATSGRFDVGEGQVNGDDPEAVTVELSERTLLDTGSNEGANETDNEIAPNGTATDANSTTDNSTINNSTTGNSTSTEGTAIDVTGDVSSRPTGNGYMATRAPVAVTDE